MERVDLTWQWGVVRTRRWRNDVPGSAFLVQVTVGRLADGRWWAQRAGYRIAAMQDGEAAFVFDNRRDGERLAVALAYSWMRDSGQAWVPVPARYSPDGSRPDDGLPWVLRGDAWVLPDPDGGG